MVGGLANEICTYTNRLSLLLPIPPKEPFHCEQLNFDAAVMLGGSVGTGVVIVVVAAVVPVIDVVVVIEAFDAVAVVSDAVVVVVPLIVVVVVVVSVVDVSGALVVEVVEGPVHVVVVVTGAVVGGGTTDAKYSCSNTSQEIAAPEALLPSVPKNVMPWSMMVVVLSPLPPAPAAAASPSP